MVIDLYMTPRQRVLASVLGAGSGMIAIPLLMRTWAPTWAVLLWLGGYMTVTFTAWFLLLRTYRDVEQWWSAAVGIWFGLLPLSATYWDPGTKSYWIAAVVVMIAITNEVSTLPYIKIGEWRIGVVASGVMLSAAAIFEVGAIALVMVPILGTIVSSADRMRRTKAALEQARATADAKTAEAQLLAKRDELTGLLNRRGIAEEIERVVSGPHTILMVDADRFKAINDGHGYATGDQVIQQIAGVLEDRLGEQWIVGRQGGDEFVAVAEGVHRVAPAVCGSALCHVLLYGTESFLHIGLSGGVVRSSEGDLADRAVSKASYAMRAAKRKGIELVEFDEHLGEEFDRMLEVTAPSGTDLRSSSLTAEFQIIVDDESNIVGCEALARWRRSDGTLSLPGGFLRVLADNGQMPLLNEVMLTKGIEFASRFNHLDDAPFVAVNIGSPSLASSELVALVADLLNDHNVAPSRLMIEITESEGFDSNVSWEAAAAALTDLGVQLAIDDFGSGYSNIERLSQLPLSYLKFDRSLTGAVDGPLGPIARGVVEFASQAEIGIIGEGIETEAELAAMRKLGVRMFQGFHFGRPCHPKVVERQVLESSSRVHRVATMTSATSS